MGLRHGGKVMTRYSLISLLITRIVLISIFSGNWQRNTLLIFYRCGGLGMDSFTEQPRVRFYFLILTFSGILGPCQRPQDPTSDTI